MTKEEREESIQAVCSGDEGCLQCGRYSYWVVRECGFGDIKAEFAVPSAKLQE